MIRNETTDHWILITHPDHARIAGQFADAWGNADFARPEPYLPLRYAIYHHDDGWLTRDTTPSLTKQGRPEGFTRALVGTYSAFEEIDLPAYLLVRAEATAAVAEIDPYAGLLVSMHTVNLLTEQADLATIRPEHRDAHTDFLARQRTWQSQITKNFGYSSAELQRGFEFLQCCDNLSLIVCSGYDTTRTLRHRHPDHTGSLHAVQCIPLANDTYTLSPWPLKVESLDLDIPFRKLAKNTAVDQSAFRSAFAYAPLEFSTVHLRKN